MSELKTIPALVLHRVKASADREAFSYPQEHGWKHVTWRQFGERVREAAMGLRALGLQNEERVAIFSGTRFDWIVADMGVLCGGGATTTIYPSTKPEDAAYIIQDSGTVFVIAEGEEHVKKLTDQRAQLPNVKKVITFDGKATSDGWVMTWDELLAKGRGASQEEYEKIAGSVKPDSLSVLIYTSGTTGKPKGVELTHDSWVYEAEAIEQLNILREDDLQFLWLPLSHSFGKVLEVVQMKIGFKTAVDGRVDKIVPNLSGVKPTFVAAVPRIFEKAYNGILSKAKAGGDLKFKIFQWALGVGKEVSKVKQAHQSVGGFLGLKYALAKKLALHKVTDDLFGGRLRYFVSGSAPLARELAEFFHACDVLILEGYGLTESSAFSFVNRPDSFKFGTVGQPAPGTQLKIAEDGEILIKGRGIMRGYRNQPDATKEALKDGWLCTGDIGQVDAQGILKITDRKKDLIKTSGGKYVAPQEIEGRFKTICPYASEVVVHGNNRNFCTALVALSEADLTKWARENGVPGGYADIVKDAKTHALIKPYFDQLNATLSSYESIKKFAILPRELTEKDGDLTPSLKVKRKAVEAKYKELLDGFYAGSVADAA
ncbi:MAG: long-chain fatty acid--CoA ligase [Archangiaceae bacterium]|nr:long-chain fatty acid--CoA ligase [Archangiaceae bacterium]